MEIKVILFDGITPFNDVEVEEINKAWGNKKHVLVYKDGEFTGIAQPLGSRTVEYWQEYFEKFYAEQELQKQESISSQEQLNTIEANTSYIVMMME